MKLVIITTVLVVCVAANLKARYNFPEVSYSDGYGAYGALNPFGSFSRKAENVPVGGYTNDAHGVVVDAVSPGTRTSGIEPTGLGGPRNSYGSTYSKVGNAAFKTKESVVKDTHGLSYGDPATQSGSGSGNIGFLGNTYNLHYRIKPVVSYTVAQGGNIGLQYGIMTGTGKNTEVLGFEDISGTDSTLFIGGSSGGFHNRQKTEGNSYLAPSGRTELHYGFTTKTGSTTNQWKNTGIPSFGNKPETDTGFTSERFHYEIKPETSSSVARGGSTEIHYGIKTGSSSTLHQNQNVEVFSFGNKPKAEITGGLHNGKKSGASTEGSTVAHAKSIGSHYGINIGSGSTVNQEENADVAFGIKPATGSYLGESTEGSAELHYGVTNKTSFAENEGKNAGFLLGIQSETGSSSGLGGSEEEFHYKFTSGADSVAVQEKSTGFTHANKPDTSPVLIFEGPNTGSLNSVIDPTVSENASNGGLDLGNKSGIGSVIAKEENNSKHSFGIIPGTRYTSVSLTGTSKGKHDYGIKLGTKLTEIKPETSSSIVQKGSTRLHNGIKTGTSSTVNHFKNIGNISIEVETATGSTLTLEGSAERSSGLHSAFTTGMVPIEDQEKEIENVGFKVKITNGSNLGIGESTGGNSELHYEFKTGTSSSLDPGKVVENLGEYAGESSTFHYGSKTGTDSGKNEEDFRFEVKPATGSTLGLGEIAGGNSGLHFGDETGTNSARKLIKTVSFSFNIKPDTSVESTLGTDKSIGNNQFGIKSRVKSTVSHRGRLRPHYRFTTGTGLRVEEGKNEENLRFKVKTATDSTLGLGVSARGSSKFHYGLTTESSYAGDQVKTTGLSFDIKSDTGIKPTLETDESIVNNQSGIKSIVKSTVAYKESSRPHYRFTTETGSNENQDEKLKNIGFEVKPATDSYLDIGENARGSSELHYGLTTGSSYAANQVKTAGLSFDIKSDTDIESTLGTDESTANNQSGIKSTVTQRGSLSPHYRFSTGMDSTVDEVKNEDNHKLIVKPAKGPTLALGENARGSSRLHYRLTTGSSNAEKQTKTVGLRFDIISDTGIKSALDTNGRIANNQSGIKSGAKSNVAYRGSSKPHYRLTTGTESSADEGKNEGNLRFVVKPATGTTLTLGENARESSRLPYALTTGNSYAQYQVKTAGLSFDIKSDTGIKSTLGIDGNTTNNQSRIISRSKSTVAHRGSPSPHNRFTTEMGFNEDQEKKLSKIVSEVNLTNSTTLDLKANAGESSGLYYGFKTGTDTTVDQGQSKENLRFEVKSTTGSIFAHGENAGESTGLHFGFTTGTSSAGDQVKTAGFNIKSDTSIKSNLTTDESTENNQFRMKSKAKSTIAHRGSSRPHYRLTTGTGFTVDEGKNEENLRFEVKPETGSTLGLGESARGSSKFHNRLTTGSSYAGKQIETVGLSFDTKSNTGIKSTLGTNRSIVNNQSEIKSRAKSTVTHRGSLRPHNTRFTIGTGSTVDNSKNEENVGFEGKPRTGSTLRLGESARGRLKFHYGLTTGSSYAGNQLTTAGLSFDKISDTGIKSTLGTVGSTENNQSGNKSRAKSTMAYRGSSRSHYKFTTGTGFNEHEEKNVKAIGFEVNPTTGSTLDLKGNAGQSSRLYNRSKTGSGSNVYEGKNEENLRFEVKPETGSSLDFRENAEESSGLHYELTTGSSYAGNQVKTAGLSFDIKSDTDIESTLGTDESTANNQSEIKSTVAQRGSLSPHYRFTTGTGSTLNKGKNEEKHKFEVKPATGSTLGLGKNAGGSSELYYGHTTGTGFAGNQAKTAGLNFDIKADTGATLGLEGSAKKLQYGITSENTDFDYKIDSKTGYSSNLGESAGRLNFETTPSTAPAVELEGNAGGESSTAEQNSTERLDLEIKPGARRNTGGLGFGTTFERSSTLFARGNTEGLHYKSIPGVSLTVGQGQATGKRQRNKIEKPKINKVTGVSITGATGGERSSVSSISPPAVLKLERTSENSRDNSAYDSAKVTGSTTPQATTNLDHTRKTAHSSKFRSYHIENTSKPYVKVVVRPILSNKKTIEDYLSTVITNQTTSWQISPNTDSNSGVMVGKNKTKQNPVKFSLSQNKQTESYLDQKLSVKDGIQSNTQEGTDYENKKPTSFEEVTSQMTKYSTGSSVSSSSTNKDKAVLTTELGKEPSSSSLNTKSSLSQSYYGSQHSQNLQLGNDQITTVQPQVTSILEFGKKPFATHSTISSYNRHSPLYYQSYTGYGSHKPLTQLNTSFRQDKTQFGSLSDLSLSQKSQSTLSSYFSLNDGIKSQPAENTQFGIKPTTSSQDTSTSFLQTELGGSSFNQKLKSSLSIPETLPQVSMAPDQKYTGLSQIKFSSSAGTLQNERSPTQGTFVSLGDESKHQSGFIKEFGMKHVNSSFNSETYGTEKEFGSSSVSQFDQNIHISRTIPQTTVIYSQEPTVTSQTSPEYEKSSSSSGNLIIESQSSQSNSSLSPAISLQTGGSSSIQTEFGDTFVSQHGKKPFSPLSSESLLQDNKFGSIGEIQTSQVSNYHTSKISASDVQPIVGLLSQNIDEQNTKISSQTDTQKLITNSYQSGYQQSQVTDIKNPTSILVSQSYVPKIEYRFTSHPSQLHFSHRQQNTPYLSVGHPITKQEKSGFEHGVPTFETSVSRIEKTVTYKGPRLISHRQNNPSFGIKIAHN